MSSVALAFQAPESVEPESRLLVVRRGLIQHLPALRAHAHRLTRSPAETEDLVQASVLRALTFAETFTPGTNLRAWLHQILDSVFLTGCRRRVRERRALSTLELDPCAWTRRDPAPTMRSLSTSVQSALSDLPECFREVVRLIDVEELSYRDAADRLEVPLGTVMSRLHRGRRLLKSRLGPAESSSSVGNDESAPARAAAA